MAGESPIHHVAPALLAAAVRKPTWAAALRVLALAATDDNVSTLLSRAADLGLDTSHLRWRQRWDDLSTDELRAATVGATTYAEVLDRLGCKPGGRSYRRLEELCADRGVQLPWLRPKLATEKFVSCVSDEAVRQAFPESRSMADLLRRVGLVPKGDNYRVMRKRLAQLNLDANELSGQRWAAGVRLTRKSLDQLLVRGQKCDGPKLAERPIEAGLMERRCDTCRRSHWLERAIPLELDHINGEHDDNRLENLRLLCPNCHALTPTYRGRNVRARRARTLDGASPGGEIR